MQTAPPDTPCGTSSRLASVPTEKKRTSRPPAASASGVASSTRSSSSPNGTRRPAERALANAWTSVKPRSARSSSVTVPTAPVAPTTPTRGPVPDPATRPAKFPDEGSDMLALRVRAPELEGVVQRADAPLDVLARDEERDLDRRRRDEVRPDAKPVERRERASSDARVASHPRAHDAHLRELPSLVPVSTKANERRLDLRLVLGRRRENDLVADLDQRVDADAGIREGLEEQGGIGPAHLEHRLLDRVRDAGDHRLLEHPFVLLPHPGAVLVGERRAHMERDAVVPRELDPA